MGFALARRPKKEHIFMPTHKIADGQVIDLTLIDRRLEEIIKILKPHLFELGGPPYR
jgi:hypothetical protein